MKRSKRTPSSAKASGRSTQAVVQVSFADASSTPEISDTPGKDSNATESSTPVWRFTRLRSGHTDKIDYLKLHNNSDIAPKKPSRNPLAVELERASHRKRPAVVTQPPRSLATNKRPRLQRLSEYRAHHSSHVGSSSSPYTCPVCSTTLSSSRALDQHLLANHSGAQLFTCVFCNLSMRTTKALQHHYVKHHRVYAPVPECLNWRLTLQCRACSQSFRTAEHLASHMDWTHSRCSSIVLMEKLPDDWRWSRDQRDIIESADAVEEEYDLAFPGRRLFYEGHPSLLEADMSIRLMPAAPVESSAPATRPRESFDVFAFTDEGADAVPESGDIEIDIVPTPSKDAGAFSSRGRKRRSQQRRSGPTREIDFEQLLQGVDGRDNQTPAEPEVGPQQSQGKQQPLHAQQAVQANQQQRQRQKKRQAQQAQPFSSETPHYVSSRASAPAPHQSFPCPICMADMSTLKSRDRHLLQRHPGVRAFACLECDCTFETYISLRRHVRAEHPLAESGAYKLLIAPGLRRRASQRAATASAAIAAAGVALKPFLCTICGVSFDLVHQLSAHYTTAHEGKRHRSVGRHRAGVVRIEQDSDIDLDTSASASVAGKMDTVGAGLEDLRLTCELCSAHFDKITALECHIASDHVDETPYECHLCPAYFPSFGRLRHHQRTVHRVFLQWKEPPQAVLTKLRARSPTTSSATVLNLAVPLRRSDMAKVAYQQLRFFDPQSAANINLESVVSAITPGDTVIFCDFCGEACHNKLELGRHLQSHSGKRLRFGCSKCGQVFEGWNAKSDLVDHTKVDHMGKARYRCSECEAQFKYSSLLKLHKERGCNSNKPLARPVVSYGCSSCDKIFCGEQSSERYRLHTQHCHGQLNRALPSSAAVQPPPTAVISGLDGVDAPGDEIPVTSAAAAAAVDAGSGSSRVVQMTLPGSKEPVSVVIHLEGPLTQETLSQAFVIQSATAPYDGDAEASTASVEPLHSLADAAAAAASASGAGGVSAVDPTTVGALATPFLA